MLRDLLAIGAVALMSTGCATGQQMNQWRPVIDSQNVDQARYEQDLSECRSYAESNPHADPQRAAADGARSSALRHGAMGVGLVAAAGVMTGGLALIPMAAAGVMGAVTGGMAGGWVGGSTADLRYQNIVSNCLVGRGYHVIDSGASYF